MKQDSPRHTVVVWDLPTRLFHWSLALCFALLWATGEVGGLDFVVPLPGGKTWFITNMDLHMWLGQAVLALVVFRVLWGLWGSSPSRFRSFVRGPGAAYRHFVQLMRGAVPAGIGHNPAGGLAIVAMLVLLFLQAGTGLFANDEIYSEGPLAHLVSSEISTRLTDLHGAVFDVLLAFVALHVAAVLYYLLRGKNLIAPMLHGQQTLPAAGEGATLYHAPLTRALLFFGAAVLAVWSLHWW
ncbi:MAG TPA: cytochrome b/b6 domain-containing protein [Steroidobacteraceae bacterium]